MLLLYTASSNWRAISILHRDFSNALISSITFLDIYAWNIFLVGDTQRILKFFTSLPMYTTTQRRVNTIIIPAYTTWIVSRQIRLNLKYLHFLQQGSLLHLLKIVSRCRDASALQQRKQVLECKYKLLPFDAGAGIRRQPNLDFLQTDEHRLR